MARTTRSFEENVRQLPEIGWQLAPVPRTDDEGSADDALAPGEMETAPLMALLVTQPAGRSRMLQKQVPAGASSSSSLTSDATAAPGPGGASRPMDRVMKTTANHTDGRAITYRVLLPSGPQTPDVIQTLSFPAPATTIGTAEAPVTWGTGRWALKLLGTGDALLLEECKPAPDSAPGSPNVWAVRLRKGAIRWAPAQGGAGLLHEVEIVAQASPTRGDGYGGTIVVRSSHAAEAAPNVLAIARPRDPRVYVYKVIQRFDPGASSHPLRLDERSDLRPLSQVAPAKYFTSGTLIGDPFVSEGPVGSGTSPGLGSTLRLSWRCDKPSGCDVVGELARLDGSTVAASGSGSDGTTFWKVYDVGPLATVTGGFALPPLRPKFTLTGPGASTPTLTFCRLTKQPTPDVAAPGEIPCDGTRGTPTPKIQGLHQGNDDPGLDSGGLELFDESGEYSILRARGQFTAEVRTAVTPMGGGDPVTTTLFKGRAIVSTVEAVGAEDPEGRHAAGQARNVSLSLLGPWSRLEEAFAPQIIDFCTPRDDDAATGQPWKVTDAAATCLGFCGVPSRAIDIPDIPSIRYFPGQDGSRLDGGASLTEFLRRTLRDMLGGVLVFDPNAKSDPDPDVPVGMWRLVRPPAAPYRPMFALFRSPPGSGGLSIGQAVSGSAASSYPDFDAGDGRMVPSTFIVRGSARGRVKRPEANRITVVGGAPDEGGRGGRVSVTLVNPKSYRAVPGQPAPDPNHPDYLGTCVPLRVIESKLQTRGAVWFAARRIFDTTAHARSLQNLTAPLIFFTDPDDPYQIAPRPPRIGDVGLVEGEDGTVKPWVVRRVNFGLKKDHYQTMDLELELLPDGRSASFARSAGPVATALEAARRRESRQFGLQASYDIPTGPGELYGRILSGQLESLPVIDGFVPQDLDPLSPTFGAPHMLPGYDDI